MSQFQVLKLFGQLVPGRRRAKSLGIVLFTLGLVLWLLIPLYDTDQPRPAGAAAQRHLFRAARRWSVLVVTTIWGYAAL